MSERLKPNFTPVPNVIFDEVLSTLAPGAVKVLFAICRYTYGWGKKSDRISLNQLAEMTGMDRANVSRAVRQLGNLVIVKPGDRRKNQASEYRINIEIADSDLVSPRQQDLVSQGQQASVRPSVKTPPIQRNTKERRNSGYRKKREPADTDPRVKSALTAFIRKYLERVGTPYVVASGKDPALLKRLLSAGHPPESIEAAMDRYLADPFYSGIGFDIGGFAKAYNRLNSAGSNKKHDYEKDAYPTL